MMTRTICFITVLCCMVFQMNAQDNEQVYKPCVLQISKNGEIKTFAIESFSYSVSRQHDESGNHSNDKQSVYLNFSIYDATDSSLIEWITQPDNSKNGKILFRDKKTGKTIKEFTFENAYVESASESIYASSYSENYNSSLNLSINCTKFTINNFPLKNLTSQDYW